MGIFNSIPRDLSRINNVLANISSLLEMNLARYQAILRFPETILAFPSPVYEENRNSFALLKEAIMRFSRNEIKNFSIALEVFPKPHPDIVNIIDKFSDSTVFFQSVYDDLEEELEDRPLDWNNEDDIRAITEALDFLHRTYQDDLSFSQFLYDTLKNTKSFTEEYEDNHKSHRMEKHLDAARESIEKFQKVSKLLFAYYILSLQLNRLDLKYFNLSTSCDRKYDTSELSLSDDYSEIIDRLEDIWYDYFNDDDINNNDLPINPTNPANYYHLLKRLINLYYDNCFKAVTEDASLPSYSDPTRWMEFCRSEYLEMKYDPKINALAFPFKEVLDAAEAFDTLLSKTSGLIEDQPEEKWPETLKALGAEYEKLNLEREKIPHELQKISHCSAD